MLLIIPSTPKICKENGFYASLCSLREGCHRRGTSYCSSYLYVSHKFSSNTLTFLWIFCFTSWLRFTINPINHFHLSMTHQLFCMFPKWIFHLHDKKVQIQGHFLDSMTFCSMACIKWCHWLLTNVIKSWPFVSPFFYSGGKQFTL